MTKQLWIISLFNSCGGGYSSYYSSIWRPSIPYSNQFHFQKVRWWGYACHQCIQQHWRSWRKFWLLGYFQTSQKDVIKWTSFIRLASFKPISTPLTYSPAILLFDGFVPRKKISQNECEGCTLSLKSAYRTYNVINNNLQCFKENYHLKWDCSNKYAHAYGVKKL